MFQPFLRTAFIVPATLPIFMVVCASFAWAQSGFSPGRNQVNPPTAVGSMDANSSRPAPLHTLPQSKPSFDQPTLDGVTGKKPSSFGGSNFALPRPAAKRPAADTSFSSRAKVPAASKATRSKSSTPSRPSATKQSWEADRSPSGSGTKSSGNGRKLLIDNCNVKLMEDIMIPAEEEGLLSELEVKEGDAIAAGKVIGTVDADRLELEAERAEVKLKIQREKAADNSALNVAIQKYKLAKEEYEVALRLGRKGSRSAHEVRRAKYSKEASYAEVKVAQQQKQEAQGLARLEELNLKQIRFIIGKMRISTPFDGHVLEILKHANEYVQKGENVIRFARMDRLWVEATVSSETCNPTDIIGQPVTVVLDQAGGNEVEFEGRVVSVPLKMEGIGKRFRVRAEVANRYESGLWLLRPGASLSMTVDLKAKTARRRNSPVKR